MMTINKIVPFALFLVVLCAWGCSEKNHNNLQGTVYNTGNGYGYYINVGDKLLIKQSTIPAYSGNVSFCDSLDAEKVCREVIKKLNKGEIPSISKKELSDLKIKTKC